jgi:hypothetical protein
VLDLPFRSKESWTDPFYHHQKHPRDPKSVHLHLSYSSKRIEENDPAEVHPKDEYLS